VVRVELAADGVITATAVGLLALDASNPQGQDAHELTNPGRPCDRWESPWE